jgi:hypothetical protein
MRRSFAGAPARFSDLAGVYAAEPGDIKRTGADAHRERRPMRQ